MFDELDEGGTDRCPKHMVHGPCADVRVDGSCEVPGVRCPFVTEPVVAWLGDARRERPLPTWCAEADPLILVDVPTPPMSEGGDALRRIAGTLAGHVDAGLLGDGNWDRVRFPPSYRAALLAAEGLRPWPGINARDRNAVALEGELAALADQGVEVVHCVTGNHPVSGHRPEATAVFELDSTQLASTAAAAGLSVSVATSAVAPPVEQRPARLAEKVRAGASMAIIDVLPDPVAMAEFVARATEASDHPVSFLAVLPLPTGAADLDRLALYTHAVEPSGWRAALDVAVDPVEVGIRLAAALAEQLLAIDGVIGLNLGLTHDGGHDEAATSLVELTRRLRG
ncbi:MAG: methylenetetrahydrofolate reductase [Actinomycetota bacterium]